MAIVANRRINGINGITERIDKVNQCFKYDFVQYWVGQKLEGKVVFIQDDWFAFCPTTTYDTERNELRITDALQWYEEINYNYLIDPKPEMCGWM